MGTVTKRRGRKSAGDLVAESTIAGAVMRMKRPDPPSELTPEQAEVWVSVVSTFAADYFRTEMHPILVQYCRHVVQARRVAQLIQAMESRDELDIDAYQKLLKMQDTESRCIASMGTKMRLTQQATVNAKVQKPTVLGAAKKPWEA